MISSNSIQNLAVALAKVQNEMPVPKKNKVNTFLNSKYVDLGELIEGSKALLMENGLTILSMPAGDGANIGLTTTILHSSGEFISETILLSAQDMKGNNFIQVAGQVVTYLRRYALGSILFVYSEEDKDGSVPQSAKKAPAAVGVKVEKRPFTVISDEKWKKWEALVAEAETLKVPYLKVDRLKASYENLKEFYIQLDLAVTAAKKAKAA